MEYTESVVSDYITGIVAEALGDPSPRMSVEFAQKRFVKTDPAQVACTWPGAPGREFVVAFSGESLENFVEADDAKLAKLRAAAIEAIRNGHKAFGAADTGPYPYLCLVD